MTEERFWKLIDAARQRAGGGRSLSSAEAQAEHLQALLAKESPEEIVSFYRHFCEKFAHAYDWGLWGAAAIINGGCGEDGFTDFRGWLIAQGAQVYQAALRDPDALAEVVDDEAACESMLYAAGKAYETRTGQDIPEVEVVHPKAPTGTAWDDDQLAERFPRLSARFE